MTTCLATTMMSYLNNQRLSKLWHAATCRSIADHPPEPLDESLTTRISIRVTTMADWIVLETTQQRKSRRCKSRKRLSWISTFPDKQGLNPATERYASPDVLLICYANENRCMCSKYQTSCPSTPKHGSLPTSSRPPRTITARLLRPPSHHTTLP